MTIGDRHLGTDTIFWIKKAFNAKWVSVPKCLSPIVPIVLAMTLLFIIPAYADITNAENYIGIVDPGFGLNAIRPERPADWTSEMAGYYYIDEANGSDSSRTWGRPGAPRKTIPKVLSAGAYVEVQGTYSKNDAGIAFIKGNGTAEKPVWIVGNLQNTPSFSHKILFEGSYVYVEGIKAKSIQIGSSGADRPADHIMVRHSEIKGDGISGAIGASVGGRLTGPVNNIIFYKNLIHGMGNMNTTTDQDASVAIVGGFSSHVWFLENTMHTATAGARVGGAYDSERPEDTHHIYFSKNEIYNTLQSGISVKYAENVVFSQNNIHDIISTPWSPSKGIGAQYGPKGFWMLDNKIHGAQYGIYVGSTNSGGDWPVYAIGNVIYDIHHREGTVYTSGSWYEAGIMMAGGTQKYILNNTIFDADAGINVPSGSGTVIENNIVSEISEAQGKHIFIENNQALAVMQNNILHQSSEDERIRVGNSVNNLTNFQKLFGRCLGCSSGDPLFVNAEAGDFRIQIGSSALDSALLPSELTKNLYQLFREKFGIDINFDFSGAERSLYGWDIGAFEFDGVATTLDPTAGSSSWTPPIGIPDPKDYFGGFDPIRTAVPNSAIYCPNWSVNLVNSIASGQASDCYYVDNIHPASTDTNNTYGLPLKPRKTIPATEFTAGSYVEVHGDNGVGAVPYIVLRPRGVGTPTKPIWYVGVNKPVVGEINVGYYNAPNIGGVSQYQYLIFDGFSLRGGKAFMRPAYENNSINNVVFRNFDARGLGQFVDSHGISMGATDLTGNRTLSNIVVYKSHVSHYGDKNQPQEECGIALGGNVSRVWILDNEVHDMAEDGIAGGHGVKRTLDYLYVGRNHIYNNITNAIDFKQVNRVVISENTIHDHYTSPTSSGPSDSVILHYGGNSTPGPDDTYKNWPADSSVLFNTIYNSVGGIRTSKANKLRIVGNVIYNIKHDPNTAWDPGTPYATGAAIHLRGNLDDTYIVDNTLYDNDMGIEIPGGGAAYSPTTTYYRGNNVIYAKTYYVVINDNDSAGINGIDPTNSTYWKSYKAEITGNIITHRSEPAGRDIFISDANTANYWVTLDRNQIYSPGGAPSISYGSSAIHDLNWLIANSTQCDHCLSSAPLFVSPPTNFSNQNGSPGINAGVLSDVYQDFFNVYNIDIRRDILGNTRPAGGNWDIGAHESGGSSQPVPSLPPVKGLLGDVSGDGKVTMFDAALVLRYTLGSLLTNEQKDRADINADGKIDGADVVAIAKKGLGL